MKAWYIIVNPKAASGKCLTLWPEIKAIFIKKNLEIEVVFTEYSMHAAFLAAEAVKNGFTRIATVGGDGTASEAVNGIFSVHHNPADMILFGHIPVGTGNDWGRTIGIPSVFEEAVEVLKKENSFVQDTCKITCNADSEMPDTRYFVNVAGMGYDAAVCKKTNKAKQEGRKGRFLYMLNIFSSLFSHKPAKTRVMVDDHVFETDMLSMNIGVGRYNGGGFMQVPHAVPDDGLLGLTLIGKMGRMGIMKHIPNLIDGSFVKHPKVTTCSGKKIIVESEEAVLLEADGESIGEGRTIFEIIPLSLKVAVR